MGRKKKMADENSNQEHSDGEGETQEGVVTGDHQNESVEELISNYKLVDLKNICRSLNLKVTGNKRPVAERIWNYYHNPQQNEEDQASSPASQDSYYQQQQQQQAVQQLQLQQQQQYLASLPPQQQQAYISFTQNLQYLQQQMMLIHSQGQPIPTQLQHAYAQLAHIYHQPLPQQIPLIMQLFQQQMQMLQMQQQQQSAQQANGENPLKRSRENDNLQPVSVKRLKTSNNEESQVMKIVDALMKERFNLEDRSHIITSLQMVRATKDQLSSVLGVLLLAVMDSLDIVDAIAYVLYEVLDKKVLETYFNKDVPRTDEVIELRNIVAESTCKFLSRCVEDSGEEDLSKSESLVKLIDLFSWFGVLEYVYGRVTEEMTSMETFTSLHQTIVEKSRSIFHLHSDAQTYLQNRQEAIQKLLSAGDLGSEEHLQFLKDSKHYFDESAIEMHSKACTVACVAQDNQCRSMWNAYIDSLKSKNVTIPSDFPIDDLSDEQYNFDKRCKDRADQWWLYKFIQGTIPLIGSTVAATEEEQQQQQMDQANTSVTKEEDVKQENGEEYNHDDDDEEDE